MKRTIDIHNPRIHACAGAFIFFLVAGLIALLHEPWRDEAQSWLLARDTSFFELIALAKYEGSFILWHLVIAPFAKLGFPFVTQTIISLLIGSATAYLIIRFAPFHWFQKILLLSGYYFLYEYTIIARSYGLTILLSFFIVCLYCARNIRYGMYTLARILLSMTNLFGFVFSVVFSVFYWATDRRLWFVNKKKIVAYEFGFLFALLVQVLFLIPPSDQVFRPTKNIFAPPNLFALLHVLNSAFLPIPPPIIHFWGYVFVSSIVFLFPSGFLVLSIIMRWVLVAARARLFFIFCALILLIIIERLELWNMRLYGMIFVSFIAAHWIQGQNTTKWSRRIFGTLLIVQVIATIPALASELGYPFSAGRDAARALNAAAGAKKPLTIISAQSELSTSLRPYLSHRFYCLEYQQFCSYMIWDARYEGWIKKWQTRQWTTETQAYLNRAVAQFSGRGTVFLITSYPLSDQAQTAQWKQLFIFPAGIVADERFYIYEYMERQENSGVIGG